MSTEPTFVVCALGADTEPMQLPGYGEAERTISGGERSLYEIACGLAQLGHSVELRGELDVATLEEIVAAVGARPHTGMAPRRPRANDVVILPEGKGDPARYATVALSEARGVIVALGPLGLCGWPFTPGWTLPDPLLVERDALNRPEHFRSISGAGFELWTNSRGTAERAHVAGVACVNLGETQPLAPPRPVRPPAERTHDIVIVGENRWASLARETTDMLATPRSVRVLERVTRNEVVDAFTDARILLLPTRVEGTARMTLEARSVGCIPACLDNPFGSAFDEKHGVLVARSLEELARGVDSLLDDAPRLERMSRAGLELFDTQGGWPQFVERLDEAARAAAERDDDASARYVRSAYGQRLHEQLESERAATAAARRELDAMTESRDERHAEVLRLAQHVDELTDELQRIHASRGWRVLEWFRSRIRRA